MAAADLSKLFPKSKFIKSFKWTGEPVMYPDKSVRGDTYPMTWADDDKIYTSSGDPGWGDKYTGLDVEVFEGGPLDYTISRVNDMWDLYGGGGDGPKPTGIICVNGVLYLASQNWLRAKVPPFNMTSQHGSDAVIQRSYDKGKTWASNANNIGRHPFFPGHKFGGPVFVQFGKNNENARDEYVYAVSSDQWDNGCNMRLGRVHKNYVCDPDRWEFVAGWTSEREPIWKLDLDEAIPVLSMCGCLGVPDMTYVKALDRYILMTWSLKEPFVGNSGTDLYIFESPEPWGPYSIVYQEEYWNGKDFTPYCPHLPLKWMAEDGLSGWIQCSGSWVNHDPYYRSHVRPFEIELY